MKICLTAGHEGYYNCNKNVSPTYWESVMAWDLHLLLKAELEKYGVTVILTRKTRDEQLGIVARGQMAKGCDLYLSLHSNACATESVDRACCIYPISGKCKSLAEKLSACVGATMQTNDASRVYSRVNSAGNADYYGEIRGAVSVGVPGLILEHSFHSNNRAAKWLLDKNNLKKLAVAEAAVIAEYYGLKVAEAPTANEPPVLSEEFIRQMKLYEKTLEDNDAGTWSEDARKWAVDVGLIAGTGMLPDGSQNFAWQKSLTREQAAQMFKKFYDILRGEDADA